MKGVPSIGSEKYEQPLTVATYNIHRFLGRDGRRDPDRIGEVISEIGADVIGLQELDFRHYGNCASSRRVDILEATGLNVIYGFTLPRQSGRFGNALITSHSVREVRRINLSVPGREPRGAIDVDLEIGGKSVQVIVTHLGLRAYERKYQIKRLLDVISPDHARPSILLGDFNEWTRRNRRVRSLCNQLGENPTLRTFPSSYPMLPLDRIWVRPTEMLMDVCVHDTPTARVASDHLPLRATVMAPSLSNCTFQVTETL
ncbi:MAG: endonuclease/exonuclease/phosphatase family protein [Syntrophobacteraceae bacterium]